MGDTLRVGLVGAGRLGEVGYVPALRPPPGCSWRRSPNRTPTGAGGSPMRRACLVSPRRNSSWRPAASTRWCSPPLPQRIWPTLGWPRPPGCRCWSRSRRPPTWPRPSSSPRLEPTPWVGFNRRFDAGVAELRAAVPRGVEVGVILEISYRRGGWGAHTVHDDALTRPRPAPGRPRPLAHRRRHHRGTARGRDPRARRVRPRARGGTGPDPLRHRPAAPRADRGPAPRRRPGRASRPWRARGRGTGPAWFARPTPARRVADRAAGGVRPCGAWPGGPDTRHGERRSGGHGRVGGGAVRGTDGRALHSPRLTVPPDRRSGGPTVHTWPSPCVSQTYARWRRDVRGLMRSRQ